MTLPFTRSVETILQAYFDWQNNVSSSHTTRLQTRHTFMSKAGEEVGERRRVSLLIGIFSRPNSLLLEPFQVLARAQRTRVGPDAPFTLASPFFHPWSRWSSDQTVVAMETILHYGSVEGGGGGVCHVVTCSAPSAVMLGNISLSLY